MIPVFIRVSTSILTNMQEPTVFVKTINEGKVNVLSQHFKV